MYDLSDNSDSDLRIECKNCVCPESSPRGLQYSFGFQQNSVSELIVPYSEPVSAAVTGSSQVCTLQMAEKEQRTPV